MALCNCYYVLSFANIHLLKNCVQVINAIFFEWKKSNIFAYILKHPSVFSHNKKPMLTCICILFIKIIVIRWSLFSTDLYYVQSYFVFCLQKVSSYRSRCLFRLHYNHKTAFFTISSYTFFHPVHSFH